jgi:RNA polymerase sigma factor (TIGR02999 family)
MNSAEPRGDITHILHEVERGEAASSEKLLPLVYDELRRLAAIRMAQEAAGQTLQPTALVHEAWLRLVGEGGRTWQNRAHFFGAATEAMRRILIESARRKSRLKRGGDRVRVDLEEFDLAATTPDDRVLLIDGALKELERQNPDLARIVTLKFFGGLTNEEVAEMLQFNERTVRRQWVFAKAWLLERIQTEI